MKPLLFKGQRFYREVILHAVWLHFTLGLLGAEELMARAGWR